MSTMGIAVYGRAEEQQLLLLRSLRENPGAAKKLESQERSDAPRRDGQHQHQHQQQQQQLVLPPYDPSRLKKHGKNGQPPPIAVAKRNARERNRVKQVNNGFATLRQHIPSHVAQGYGDRGKKLSKVETLRMAVEYIRGLQRLLAEADGLEYAEPSRNPGDSSIMIPSPAGSVYSGSTHNGSGGEILCLGSSELDEGGDPMAAEEPEAYFMDEDEEDNEKERREAKRFREDGLAHNRLSENQNRDRTLLSSAPRRRRNSPTTLYTSRQSSFGDEENIEPLTNRNNNTTSLTTTTTPTTTTSITNNNNTTTTNNNANNTPTNNNNSIIINNNNNNNNNSLLSGFSPILVHSTSPITSSNLPSIKREICLLDEEESRRSNEEDSGPLLTVPTPYTGEILIENPETGRLVPLKLEGDEEVAAAGAQLVYVAASADGLPGATYYKHELAPDSGSEFLDVVSWWEQEHGRISHQLQAHHHHHHHHHHHVGQHQQAHQQTHQQLTAQQRLAHV